MGLDLLKQEISRQCAKLCASSFSVSNSIVTRDHPHPSVMCSQLLELVADVNQACGVAVEILNELLLYEKIDGGLLVLEAQEIPLWSFMEEVLKLFAVQVRILIN
jgi:hypothetical protein